MKTIITTIVFCAVICSVSANSLISRGGMGDKEMEKRRKAAQEALDKQNRETSIYNHKKWVEEYESEEEKRIKETASKYDKQAEDRVKSLVFAPNSTFKENIEKNKLKIIEVENLNEAGASAKKQASKDSNYIVKQIETSNELSLYKITTTYPYFINDSRFQKIKTQTLDYEDIKYKKTFVMEYPPFGISAKRTYKFITLSKSPSTTQLKFEEGEVIFVQKGLDLNVKMNQLYCVNLSGSIPSDIVKKVISQHNKEITASETKSKKTNK